MRRGPARLAPLVLLGGALASLVACEFLDAPEQCASNDDCTRFAGATCDLQARVCVSPGVTGGGAADGGPSGGEDDATSVTPPLDSGPPLPPQCEVSPKPVRNAADGLTPTGDGGAQIAASLTLGCDKDWTLDRPLVVGAEATLTIAAGTTIRAKKGLGVAIVVLPGGRIVAEGQRNAPIVLTVDDPAPAAGDWRGVFLLGKAPRTGGTAPFEGDPLLTYGGNAPNDDSGSLAFVRIEYSKTGLMLGAVGRATKVDSVQVRHSNDNCFAFNGGTVNAKHLVCQQTLDEQFEMNQGYSGKLQFLYGQKVGPGEGHHGMLVDGTGTAPVVYNATICGQAGSTNVQGHGLVFRNNAKIDANDVVISGWLAALDAQSANLGAPMLLRASVAFGNTANPGFLEVADGGGQLDDDDNGFDEIDFFRDGGGNVEADPQLVACHDAVAPKPWPAKALIAGARTPPNDGFFDPAAKWIGAFKDANDPWMTGTWARFDSK